MKDREMPKVLGKQIATLLSSIGKHFATIFQDEWPKKILEYVLQSNCMLHAKIQTNPSKIEKQPKNIQHRSVMLSALQFVSGN